MEVKNTRENGFSEERRKDLVKTEECTKEAIIQFGRAHLNILAGSWSNLLTTVSSCKETFQSKSKEFDIFTDF